MRKTKDKYITIYISNVITQIAEKTNIEGYSIGIIEIIFPENHVKWTGNKCNKWIKENNERMNAICDFLNNKHL